MSQGCRCRLGGDSQDAKSQVQWNTLAMEYTQKTLQTQAESVRVRMCALHSQDSPALIACLRREEDAMG